MMDIDVTRTKGIPVYLKLKDEIKRLIQIGQWPPGTKIPTERELAEQLNISRNTVSSAYKELEAEGILVSTQGKGTFVTDSDAIIKCESRKERLLKIIDMALEEAIELGFTIEEFLAITYNRGMEKKEMLSRVKVAFVECNKEQLDDFSKELHLGYGVSIVPVLLEDFRSRTKDVNEKLSSTELIITTFFHLQEVKSLMADKSKEVIGIALNPQLETIVKIARIPAGKKLGIICLSTTFTEKVRNSLRQAGIDHLKIQTTTTKNESELKEFLSQVDVVVVSPNRKKEVIPMAPRGKPVIEFRYLPDTGSVNVVKTALIELKGK
ncbi:GntR family transcriptional regulator [Thermincola ferriacetica]|nr:GntR family transcriptional regulator [Thermincola ferriacetica]